MAVANLRGASLPQPGGMTTQPVNDDWFAANAPSVPIPPTGGQPPPPGGQPGGAPTPPSGGGPPGDPDAFGRAWIASGGQTVQDLQNFVAQHPEFGATLFGSKNDKLRFPGGQEFDGVLSAGAGGKGATFNRLTPGGGDGGGTIGGGAPVGGYAIFNAPTLKDLYNSPGWQAGLDASRQAVERSAFARGTGLTGGTLKALQRNAIQYAGQGYNNLFSQRLQGNAQTSGNLLDLARLGKPS